MNGQISRKTHDQATLAPASVRILLKYLTIQQSLFDLDKSQLICLAFDLCVESIDILIGVNFGLDLCNVHA